MPSHLEEKKNDQRRQQLSNDKTTEECNVEGNVGADIQAKHGVETDGHAVPPQMIQGSQFRASMTWAAQNMMVTIWAKRIKEEVDPALHEQLNIEGRYVKALQQDLQSNVHDDDDHDRFL